MCARQQTKFGVIQRPRIWLPRDESCESQRQICSQENQSDRNDQGSRTHETLRFCAPRITPKGDEHNDDVGGYGDGKYSCASYRTTEVESLQSTWPWMSPYSYLLPWPSRQMRPKGFVTQNSRQ